MRYPSSLRLNGLIQICTVIVGYQVKWFDPDMCCYCGGIRLNGVVQIRRVIIVYQVNGLIQIYIGYYTGSRSVRLDVFTSLMYSVMSAGRDKIQRRVQIVQLHK